MLKKREYPRLGETVWRDILPNGLRLTVVPRRGFRKTFALLAVKYGGADSAFRLGHETITPPAGAAHFIEHKLFELEDGSDALTLMTERGANANAFTSPDMTAYYFECVDSFYDDLELLLKFVLTPVFRPESVEREKSIIASEIRMMEDDPDDRAYYALMRSLYAHAPLRESVAGTVESVERITPEILHTCHRAFYTPSNMSLVVVGDREPKRVRETAMRLLPEEPAFTAYREAARPESKKPVEPRAESSMDIGAPIFLAGAKTAMDLKGAESVKFELTAAIALSALMGEASPLYHRLYSEGLINETFGFDFENSGGFSHLSFGGESRDPDLVCLRVLEEAARLAAAGIDGDFFTRRKKTAYGSVIRALGSFESICCDTAAGDFFDYDYFNTPAILDSVTPDDVRRFLGEYITSDRVAMSVINTKGR